MGNDLHHENKANELSSTNEPPSIGAWIKNQHFKTTKDIDIPERLVDQVIGQDDAVVVIKKAAEQKRHVMLIGDPGTGKSMLAKSMTEFLPKDELQDVIAYHNADDPNEPKIRVVPAGKGREIVGAQKAEAMRRKEQKASMTMLLAFMIIGIALLLSIGHNEDGSIKIEPMVLIFGIFDKQERELIAKHQQNIETIEVLEKRIELIEEQLKFTYWLLPDGEKK